MASIKYPTFRRLLLRCAEVAAEKGMKPLVTLVYNERLKAAAEAFLTADDGVTTAVSAFAKENKEALAALGALDGPYKEARSVVAAFVPTLDLPDTLKVQPTDTDKLSAIQDLLDILHDHAGEDWADTLLASPFTQQAAATTQEIDEAIDANKALSAAREKRAAAYGPAYERYLKFKQVVRDSLGSRSKQYKRVHLRSAAPVHDEDGAAGGATSDAAEGGETAQPGATAGSSAGSAGAGGAAGGGSEP